MIHQIIISSQAQQLLIAEIKRNKFVETGGVLCGYYAGDNKLYIDQVSGPGPKARKSAIEFIIDKKHMHQYLDDEYSRSDGKNIYVGEWHTHPEIHPHPSGQDFQSFKERILEWTHGDLVFIIIGFLDFREDTLNERIIAIAADHLGQFYKVPILFETN